MQPNKSPKVTIFDQKPKMKNNFLSYSCQNIEKNMMQLQHKLEIKCETIKQATPKQYQTGSI